MKVCDPPSVPPAIKPHLFRLSVYLGLSLKAVGPRPGTVCSFSTWAQDRPLKQGCKAWEDALHPQPCESRLARLPPPEPPQRTLVCLSTDSEQPNHRPLSSKLTKSQALVWTIAVASYPRKQSMRQQLAHINTSWNVVQGNKSVARGRKTQDMRGSGHGSQMWATDAQFCWDHVRSCLE